MPTDNPTEIAGYLARRLDEVRDRVHVAHVNDPADRLLALRALEAVIATEAESLRHLRRSTIDELRRPPLALTWRVIGDLLGVSTSRAEQLAAPTTPEGTPDAR